MDGVAGEPPLRDPLRRPPVGAPPPPCFPLREAVLRDVPVGGTELLRGLGGAEGVRLLRGADGRVIFPFPPGASVSRPVWEAAGVRALAFSVWEDRLLSPTVGGGVTP